jgi:hypothetical protein
MPWSSGHSVQVRFTSDAVFGEQVLLAATFATYYIPQATVWLDNHKSAEIWGCQRERNAIPRA